MINWISLFTKTDLVAKFDVEVLLRKINSTLFHSQVISFVSDSSIVIQASNIKSGIPLFSLNWHSNFKFDCYHLGVRYFILSLSQNKIVKINRCSVLEEAINYLSKVETSHKNEVLNDYRNAMSSASSVGSIVYSPATLIRAFEYFSCSRASYELFRRDHHLPSVRTLTRITSKINNLQSFHFVRTVLDSLQDQQRQVVLLIDEINVKPSLCYHGGKGFGKAQNNPEELASTVLAIMVKCLFWKS